MPDGSPENDPQQIAAILDALKVSSPLGRQLDYARIWEEWASIAGTEFADRTQPVNVRNGVLTIAADSSVLIHRLSFERVNLIRKINKKLTTTRVEDLYFTLPTEDQLDQGASDTA